MNVNTVYSRHILIKRQTLKRHVKISPNNYISVRFFLCFLEYLQTAFFSGCFVVSYLFSIHSDPSILFFHGKEPQAQGT